MNEKESSAVLKFVWGLISGVVLAVLYIRFGIELPGIIGWEQKLVGGAVAKTAEMELFNNELDELSRRRALALILANRPETFLEVDQAMGNRFYNEYLKKYWPNQAIQHQPLVLESEFEPIGIGGGTISGNSIGVPKQGQVIPIGSGILVNKKLLGTSVHTSNLIRQQYPDASEEVIAFLNAHPELIR